MASLKTTVCLTIALLATTVVISVADNTFCSLADDKVLCGQLAKEANDWPAAMTNTIQSSLEITQRAKSLTDMIAAHMPNQLKDVSKKDLDSVCREIFDNIKYNLDKSIGFVEQNDFGSLKAYLSAVSFDECTDELAQFGATFPEAMQFRDEVQKLDSVLLAVADRKNES